jgi:hypothetical protein
MNMVHIDVVWRSFTVSGRMYRVWRLEIRFHRLGGRMKRGGSRRRQISAAADNMVRRRRGKHHLGI